uniref:Uncharacterized protein n=1 Tax=Oryza brachyantha TaxID=4533 RepID=J3LVS9_ORYBR
MGLQSVGSRALVLTVNYFTVPVYNLHSKMLIRAWPGSYSKTTPVYDLILRFAGRASQFDPITNKI